MKSPDFKKLLDDTVARIREGARSVAIIGDSAVARRLLDALNEVNLAGHVSGAYDDGIQASESTRPLRDLQAHEHDLLVIASDDDKEAKLWALLPMVRNLPRVVVAGYGHYKYRNETYQQVLSLQREPSLANGYPNSLIHLFQCLENAARLKLEGVVAEFGIFRGGTTLFLANAITKLGMKWPVIGFDTFGGFPERRSILDMYSHPDCVNQDVEAVRQLMRDKNVEIIVGDIVDTSRRLNSETVVVSFVDTDNYTSARSALAVLQERTVVGGAIIFDHFTGTDRFRYTLGERMAAETLLSDERYFNLHGTGVFMRQR